MVKPCAPMQNKPPKKRGARAFQPTKRTGIQGTGCEKKIGEVGKKERAGKQKVQGDPERMLSQKKGEKSTVCPLKVFAAQTATARKKKKGKKTKKKKKTQWLRLGIARVSAGGNPSGEGGGDPGAGGKKGYG